MTSPIRENRPGDYTRNYVPTYADVGDWNVLEKMFNELEAQNPDSKDMLEKWLDDQSELLACVAEEHSRRHIEMTCATDNEECEKRYIHMITEI